MESETILVHPIPVSIAVPTVFSEDLFFSLSAACSYI